MPIVEIVAAVWGNNNQPKWIDDTVCVASLELVWNAIIIIMESSEVLGYHKEEPEI